MSSSIPMIPGGTIGARLAAIAVILAARAYGGAPQTPALDTAEPVFACNFDSAWDANYDGWPDGWTRAAGPGQPKYVTIELAPPADAQAPSLCIQMDGGGAAAYSPLCAASGQFSYQVALDACGEGLARDAVWASLNFYDADRRLLETHAAPRFVGSQAWTTLTIPALACRHRRVRYFSIGLHVEPTGRPDVRGAARFRQLRVHRLPRLEIESQPATSFFTSPTQVKLSCTVSGHVSASATLRFALADMNGRTLDEFAQPLPSPSLDWLQVAVAGRRPASWSPTLPDFGFYRATVTLDDGGRVLLERSLPLAVVGASSSQAANEFGWSLTGDESMAGDDLARLMAQAGIGWFKTPLWFEANDPLLGERIALIERASSLGVRAVGIFDRPPAPVLAELKRGVDATAADVFSGDPKLWYPSVEETLARLGLRVRWWQLGAEGDASFVGDAQVFEKLREVRQRFEQMGHGAGLGLSWNWLYPPPPSSEARFLSLAASPALTPDELREFLRPSAEGLPRWVLLEALSRREHTADERAADLVLQMIAAKVGRADAIFLRDPFDEDRGLVTGEGTPDDLFVPWRNAALTLAGSKHLGSLELPGQSRNHAFQLGDQVTLALWADAPGVETLQVGDAARAFDLWGRERPLTRTERGCELAVGPEPCFVTGIDAPLVAWQLGVQLEPARLASRLGGTQSMQVVFTNELARSASGSVSIVAPERWQVAPPRYAFKAQANGRHVQPLEIALPYDASGGTQWVRLDFEVSAGQTHAFSVYRQVQVGDDDVELKAAARLNAAGELEVEQRLVNRGTAPLNFHCDLFVKGRKRIRSSVLERDQGEDVRVYRLRDGQELLGQTLLLRAEEIGGTRVINTRIVAEP